MRPLDRLARLGVLGLAAAALSCAGSPLGQPAASEDEQVAYGAAVAALESDRQEGVRQLEAFLVASPQSPLADDALMRLAEDDAARGDAVAALGRYAEVVNLHPRGDQVDAARVEIARLELAAGRPEMAARQVRGARLSRLGPAERRVAFRVLADTATDPVERLRWLAPVRGAETDEEEIARVDQEIDELIAQMDSGQLASAAEQIGDDIPSGRIWLAAAQRALAASDLARARDWFDESLELAVTPEVELRRTGFGERLRLLEAGPVPDVVLPDFAEYGDRTLPSTAAARGRLGVVLPLTGSFAGFGEVTLQGVLLAAGVFGDAGPGAVEVLIRDTGGRPDRAAAAVRELADAGVVAVVGPLLSGECEAAATAAEGAGVPLVALTAREEVSAARPHVFRVRTMPREEVDVLVDHAMRELGAERFAILYPRDAYGRGLRRLFWEAVERRGGRVTGVGSYDPDSVDFAAPIRRLVGYEMLTPAEEKLLKERADLERRARRLPPEEAAALREEAKAMLGPDDRPLPPIVDFDALFIPEAHEKVVLIAPQLAFHQATGMTLLGPNGWYHPDLVRIAREHVEGARFTTDFYAESSLPFVREFQTRYQDAYAESPDRLAAQAFDAANLVLLQLARGRETREAVRDGILDVNGYPGVTGILTIRRDGNARKRPFLLAVERGRIEQVD